MNFGFNAEQKSLGDTVAERLGDFPALLAPDPADAHDPQVWDALAELGLFALLVPEEDGGVGLSLVDVALAVEALGAGLAPPIVASTLIATDILVTFGTAAKKSHWLPVIATGEARIAIAVLESGQGYDPGAVKATFKGGRLNGAKILTPGGQDAHAFLVLARGDHGPVLVIVDRETPGLSVRPHSDLDASSDLCELVLNQVAVDDGALAGLGLAGAAVDRLVDVAATVYAGLEIGIAARMLETAVEYAKTREQFGQAIGAFQAIKHRCADMAVAVEAGRSAAYYAFWAVSEDAPDRGRASSMAKAYCGEVTRDACNETIQIHGGMGFTWELGLHRFLRRAKVMEHAFGNHVWHYERVALLTLCAGREGEVPQRGAA